MHAGADKYKNQRGDDRIGDTDFRLKLLGVFGIALIHAFKEPLAVLDIFRKSIDLIHQPIFFAVPLRGPVGDFSHKSVMFGLVGVLPFREHARYIDCNIRKFDCRLC